jgi:hypothetical protein
VRLRILRRRRVIRQDGHADSPRHPLHNRCRVAGSAGTEPRPRGRRSHGRRPFDRALITGQRPLDTTDVMIVMHAACGLRDIPTNSAPPQSRRTSDSARPGAQGPSATYRGDTLGYSAPAYQGVTAPPQLHPGILHRRDDGGTSRTRLRRGSSRADNPRVHEREPMRGGIDVHRGSAQEADQGQPGIRGEVSGKRRRRRHRREDRYAGHHRLLHQFE